MEPVGDETLTEPQDESTVAQAGAAATAPPARPGGDSAVPAEAAAPARRLAHIDYKWVALGVVLIGSIMTILDATIVNIAIRTLQKEFSVTNYADVAWVVTAYTLAQGSVIPITGWATDRWGTKRLYLWTIFLFTAASAACGLAGNLGMLIFFRVLQGIGGGMLMPIGMTIILRVVGPRQMGRVMGIFGIPMLLAPAAGPVLGGWFVQDFTWRLIFYVNVPIGILAFILSYRLLTETPRSHGLRLDIAGVLTATPAVVALMYAVDVSTALGWGSALVVSLLAVFVLLSVAFVANQLKHDDISGYVALVTGLAAGVFAVTRATQVGWLTVDALSMAGTAVVGIAVYLLTRKPTEEPLLHLELFKDTTFSASMILSFIIVTTMFGSMLLLPIFLQQVHGYDALQTGLFLLPQATTAAIAMPLGGWLTDKIGPRIVVPIGLVLLGIGSVMLAGLKPDTPSSYLIIALALRGFAMGFAMMPSMSAALARVPRRFTSRASSITNTLQRVGSSIGIAVLVTFLAAQFTVSAQQAECAPSTQVVAQASSLGLGSTPAQVCATLGARIADATTGKSTAPQGTPPQPLGSFASGFANQTLSIAFDRTFAFIAILSFLGIIPALFLRRPENHADATEALAA